MPALLTAKPPERSGLPPFRATTVAAAAHTTLWITGPYTFAVPTLGAAPVPAVVTWSIHA